MQSPKKVQPPTTVSPLGPSSTYECDVVCIRTQYAVDPHWPVCQLIAFATELAQLGAGGGRNAGWRSRPGGGGRFSSEGPS